MKTSSVSIKRGETKKEQTDVWRRGGVWSQTRRHVDDPVLCEYLYLYVYKKDRRTLPKALQGLQHYNTSDYEDTSSGRHRAAPRSPRR